MCKTIQYISLYLIILQGKHIFTVKFLQALLTKAYFSAESVLCVGIQHKTDLFDPYIW